MGVAPLVIALLAAAAVFVNRRKVRDYLDGRSRLDDDMIRRIEEQGSIEIEEPLDLEQVREEEERFWSETWDVPDDE
jgi:hypothetical protein